MFPQSPFGGSGGMTPNQVPQPMQSGQQAMPPMQQMVPSQNPMMPQAGAQQPYPQAGMQQGQGIDPQQLAMLRMRLMQQAQQQPNLRALLGL